MNIAAKHLLAALVISATAWSQNPPSAAGGATSAPVIQYGDVLSVVVNGEPDLGLSPSVNGKGQINLALVQAISVVGLTETEAAKKIAKQYRRERFLKSPEVTVRVTKPGPPRPASPAPLYLPPQNQSAPHPGVT